jgi:hypothetical protein
VLAGQEPLHDQPILVRRESWLGRELMDRDVVLVRGTGQGAAFVMRSQGPTLDPVQASEDGLPGPTDQEARRVADPVEELRLLPALVRLGQRPVSAPNLEDLLALHSVAQHLDLAWVDPALKRHVVESDHWSILAR